MTAQRKKYTPADPTANMSQAERHRKKVVITLSDAERASMGRAASKFNVPMSRVAGAAILFFESQTDKTVHAALLAAIEADQG